MVSVVFGADSATMWSSITMTSISDVFLFFMPGLILVGWQTVVGVAYIPEQGSIAQGLEHWSCKPGVASSNLAGAFKKLL